MKALNMENFKEETEHGLVVVDFGADWCPPCKMMEPVVEAASQTFKDRIAFKSVDIDDNPEIAQALQVQGIPTFLVIKDGHAIDRFSGFIPAPVFKSHVEQYLG